MNKEELYSEIGAVILDKGRDYALDRYKLRDIYATGIYKWLCSGNGHGLVMWTDYDDISNMYSLEEHKSSFIGSLRDLDFEIEENLESSMSVTLYDRKFILDVFDDMDYELSYA